MIELSIKITDEDASLTERFLIYEPILLSQQDKTLEALVEQTKSKFKGELKDPEISIRAKMTW